MRKKVSHESLRENHEVAGFIFNAFELIYAVLIAFVVFATWSSYDESEKNVEMEANKLSDMFLDANAFSDTLKYNIRSAITEYTKAVVEQEWPIMQNHEKVPSSVIESLRKVWNAYEKVDMKSINNPHMYDESLRQLNSMSEYRRLRWLASRKSTPGVIWLVLIAGALASVSYTFFFGTKHVKAQYVMTSVLTVINAFVLFLIFILDHPFTGYSAISNDAFKTILGMFTHMMGG
ncbi:MAG: DUF4239 domain-containing protein [Ignavibacteria bacterium]